MREENRNVLLFLLRLVITDELIHISKGGKFVLENEIFIRQRYIQI